MNYLTEAIELHDTLNPKFWKSDMQLKPDVRQKVLEIVDEFKENVTDMTGIELNPLDIYIVGSNASYNYTDKSDLDVHIVINFDTIDDNTGLVQSLMNFQKSEFNKGYDITIYDTDVELYVEDINSSTMSNGIFSVMQDQWIKKPEPIEVPEIEGLEDAVDEWKEKINAALDSKDPTQISKTIDDLYILRKNGLLSTGEYGKDNQTFKDVRNLGLLKDLKDSYMKLRSKELSLEKKMVKFESYRDDLENQIYYYYCEFPYGSYKAYKETIKYLDRLNRDGEITNIEYDELCDSVYSWSKEEGNKRFD